MGKLLKFVIFSTNKKLIFRLGDRIWYKFNDNIDINKTTSNILVAISVILESDAGEELYFDDENFGKFQNVDISKTNLEVFRHLSKDKDKKEQLTLSSPWMKIEEAQEFNFGGTLRINARFPVQKGIAQLFTTSGNIQHDYSTTYSNLVNIVNGNIALKGDLVDQLKFKVKKIIVKVMPSMDFNSLSSAGTKINTTQEFSYLLYDKDANINLISTKGQWLNSTNKKQGAERYIPYKITLDNVTLTTSSPYVNSIVGNKIIVNANEIEILNGLSVQSGYIAELNAYKEINIISGDINSDISLNIKNDFYNSSKITEATQAEVNGFCKVLTKEYKADIDASSSFVEFDIDTSNQQANPVTIEFPIKATISPNPTTANFTVSIFNNNEQDYSIALMDVTGKVLLNNNYNGKQTSQFIETNGLAAGIYFVKITCGNTQKTEKLIIHNNH